MRVSFIAVSNQRSHLLEGEAAAVVIAARYRGMNDACSDPDVSLNDDWIRILTLLQSEGGYKWAIFRAVLLD